MKKWRIDYISFEGNVRWTEVETEDDVSDADYIADKAKAAEGNYSGDNICEVLSVNEVWEK
jgi:hypothetical protein